MKIGDRINLDTGNNKQVIERIIDDQGYAKDVNQTATTYYCIDDNGMEYEIVQFWNNRNFVNICSHSV